MRIITHSCVIHITNQLSGLLGNTDRNPDSKLCELPEGGTNVPKPVAAVKEHMVVYVICAFVWFYE
jgi:hypothetical protein